MEKAFEFFDTWLKSQKDFLDNWLMYQEGLSNWIEATKKIQESLNNMSGILGFQAGSPRVSDLFTSWFTLMLNSSKQLTEWIIALQNVWKTMMEKQMEMSKEIAKQFFDLLTKVGETKQESDASKRPQNSLLPE